jgi:hypothetical protein
MMASSLLTLTSGKTNTSNLKQSKVAQWKRVKSITQRSAPGGDIMSLGQTLNDIQFTAQLV